MRIRLDFPLKAIKSDLIKVQDKLKAERPRVLGKIGSKMLQFARQEYRSLSEGGGAPSDGRQWKSLDDDTFEASARRKAAARRLVTQRRVIAAQIKSTKGKGSGARKAVLRKKRAALMEQLRALFAKDRTTHKPGLDTKRQKGKASYRVNAQSSSVTVGFGNFNILFDEERELMPEDAPAAWLNACDEILESWAGDVARSVLT